MRIRCLCLLLCLLAPMSWAQSSSQPGNSTAGDQKFSSDKTAQVHASDPAVLRRWLSADGTEYCAYIRAYRVTRDSRDTDSVHLSGYTTCVSTAGTGLKSAVQVETTPNSR